jgi:hypothetical protein
MAAKVTKRLWEIGDIVDVLARGVGVRQMTIVPLDMLEIVMQAFERAGGRAEFQRVYPIVERIFKDISRPIPVELDAQVRQTVYLYCPDSPNYLNQGKYFEKCGRGEYKVTRPTPDDL